MKKILLALLIVVSTISYSQNVSRAISFIEDTYYQEHLLGTTKQSIDIEYNDNKVILKERNIIGNVRNDNTLTTIYLDDIDKKGMVLELINLSELRKDMSGYIVNVYINTKEETIKVFSKKLFMPRSKTTTRKTKYVDKVKLNSLSMDLPLPVAKKYTRSVCDLFGINYNDVKVKMYDWSLEKMVDSDIKITK